MRSPLTGKTIVLGVCGGIGAYKAADFIRILVKDGAAVRVVMTRSAQEFIRPLTFEALSGNTVWTGMFDGSRQSPFRHIDWAEEADATVVLPATANTIAKIACGMADDPLTTFLLAAKEPILVCPAMNVRMCGNPVVQENLERLRHRSMHIVGPEEGPLACGQEGAGRLISVEVVAEHLRQCLSSKDFSGERVLVTAGPTREFLDPVRFISNPSSGKMGYAIARAARMRGAEVVLVTGPTHLPDPWGVTMVRVTSAGEMLEAVLSRFDDATVVVKAAAVSDFRPERVSLEKIKKTKAVSGLPLERTTDILKTLGERNRHCVLVGFAAETSKVLEHARIKLVEKKLDLVVANEIGRPEGGFESDTNKASLVFADGRSEELPLMAKKELAHILLDRVLEIKAGRFQKKSPSVPLL